MKKPLQKKGDCFYDMDVARDDGFLPWRWILEHLIDMKDIGTPILREMMAYIPNLAHLSILQRRIAVRYLEEAISGSRIDAQAIPLVAVLLKESQQASSFPTSSDYRALLLQVQIEAVIMHVRGKQRDWQGFSRALDQIFTEDAVDSCLIKKRDELLALLQERSHERKCLEVLETYSLTALRRDLLKCITAEKGRLGHTFLDKLLQDVFNGAYPVSAGSIGKPTSEKEESQEDFHSADGQKTSTGSDDQTIVGGRNSNAESEEGDETHLKDSAATRLVRNNSKNDAHQAKRKRHSTQGPNEVNMMATKKISHTHPELRERDRHGKAITSISPVRAMKGKGMQEPSPRSSEDEEVAPESADNSLHVEFLNVGSDGHEEFCHKCKEGGRLLCCDGCSIAVHRKCLGYDSKSYLEEEWFCPLCVQKRAAKAVMKAREEESAARQRVLQFMANGDIAAQKQPSRSSKRNSEQSSGRKLVPEDIKEPAVCDQDQAKAVFKKSTSKTHANKQASTPSKGTSKQVSAPRRRRSSVDLYETWADISSKEGRPVRPSSKNVPDMPLEQEGGKGKRKEGKTMEGPKRVALGEEDAEETHRINDQKHTNVASSSKAGQANQGEEQVNMQGQVGDGDGHDGDLEEDSESREPESSKPKKDKKRYSRGNRIIPGMRRKRLQWTKEEEDALREGVRRFSHDNGSWGFQWTRILEFGKGKFHPSRTDVDLKDKWRNLAKASK